MVPNGHDREWTRLCLAVDGFRARYHRWPTRVRLMPDCLALIRDGILTPEGYASVESKIELVAEKGATYIAEDGEERRFNYGRDESTGEPDVRAEDWFGNPAHRHETDPLEYVTLRDADGNVVHPLVKPDRVRYIKLGQQGKFEKECIDGGTILFGFDTGSAERFPLCLENRWDDFERVLIADGKDQGTATNITNQARHFFEDAGATLWITFADDRLYWGFLSPDPPERHESGFGVIRTVLNGWRSTDLNGEPLTKNHLAGSLTKVAAYRGTSCDVDVADYAVRRINGQTTPEVERAVTALEEVKAAVLDMIRLLDPKDFEILVDLVFSISGWRRQGIIGGTTKTLDLDLLLPSTGERAFVQVKSKTNTQEFSKYVAKFSELDAYHRMFFVYHSGKDLETDDERVTVIGPEKMAEMAIDAGLVNWLIRKVT